MEKIRLGLIGCGGMGTRHLYGLRELTRTPFCNVELSALCDISRGNAELAASEAEKLLDIRPAIFTNLEEMAREMSDLNAVSVVTEPSIHHDVACQALELGLHVMVEKPMAITVKACQKMIEEAERNGCKLSVAENYRRDASARLVHHLLEINAIGKPYMALLHSLSGGNSIFITPWRHLKERGGPIFDMGVHFADMIRYQLGDIEEVYGDAWLIEPVRKKPESIGNQYTFYQKRFNEMESTVPATAEDVSLAMFRMKSGVMVNWIVGRGGHGSCGGQLILGTEGVIKGFGSRGSRISMKQSNKEEMSQEEILANIDGFSLEPLAEYFFPDGVATADVDWKILALEYYELAEAILNDREIEVDGTEGLKDVAAIYAIFESSGAGRTVKMSEVENCQVYEYQAEIDEVLSIA